MRPSQVENLKFLCFILVNPTTRPSQVENFHRQLSIGDIYFHLLDFNKWGLIWSLKIFDSPPTSLNFPHLSFLFTIFF